MAKRPLPEIPLCKLCGGQVIGSGGDICKNCQNRKTREGYNKAINAENILSKDKKWIDGYSPWKNIVLIPALIVFLIIIVIMIYFVKI